MLTIALDAMGGDHAPKAEVEGAVRAAGSLGVKVILVGQQDVVRRELEQHEGYRDLPIEIVHASERVTMEDSAAKAVRSKRDSSMRVASRLVRDGCAQGFVSAGNTGAVMATAKMVQGVVPGVDRPALLGIFPTMVGTPVVLVDVGANVDCSPDMLAQFAVMGEIYSRNILHRPNPRVGHPLHRRGRAQGQRSDPRRLAAAEEPAHQLHRQRGRPRYLRRQRGRDRLRRLHRQRGAQGERGPGGHVQEAAARIAGGHHQRQDRLRALQERASPVSGSAWTIPNTAALRCSACAAAASSATAPPTPMPSRTRSAWRRSSPAARSTSRSKKNCAGSDKPATSSRNSEHPGFPHLITWRRSMKSAILRLFLAACRPASRRTSTSPGRWRSSRPPPLPAARFWSAWPATSRRAGTSTRMSTAAAIPTKIQLAPNPAVESYRASSSPPPSAPSTPTSTPTPRPTKATSPSCSNCS